MSELKSKIKVKMGSERNFGFVFSIIFLILSLYPLYKGGSIRFIFLIISIMFLFLSIFFPKILKIPNKLWFKFGQLLGYIVSPIVMLLIYIIVFFPIGIFFKLFRKDLLNIKIDIKKSSYWINKEDRSSTMKNQF